MGNVDQLDASLLQPTATPFAPPIAIPIPLIKAIAANEAVVYVGAGASIPAGLPTWGAFIRECLDIAKRSGADHPDDWRFTESLLQQSDLLTVAELLHQRLGIELEHQFWNVFGKVKAPSSIHRAIARIPFSLAITTNFDLLLEGSYPSPAYPWPTVVHTWRDPDAFFSAIKNRRFAVVKTHGIAGNGPSLVLTRTQYRDLINRNDSFNSCLRMLLSLRTFLFVGVSLRDHDLLKLMDEARLLYGPEFGPHYAILFDDEVDDHFVEFLERSYAISVLVCRRPKGQPSAWWDAGSVRATHCTAVLREVSGKTALFRHSSTAAPSLDDPLFSRVAACEQLLHAAIALTGSFRGEICLNTNETLRSLDRAAVHPPLPPSTTEGSHSDVAAFPEITPSSVIGNLFIKAKQTDDVVYLPDVSHPSVNAHLAAQGFADAQYVPIHSDVQSQLACPIWSDGTCVGILNVESTMCDAYTRDHAEVLRRISYQVGWVYLEAQQRKECSRGFAHYFEKPRTFGELIRLSRFLKDLSLRFILWEIDYLSGRLVAHSEIPPVAPSGEPLPPGSFCYRFTDHSLATLALKTRQRHFIDNAQKELERNECRLGRRGCDAFGIRGPIVALPVRRQSHTSAVLVAWSDATQREQDGALDTLANVYRFAAGERIHRMAHLIANDVPLNGHSRAEAFLRFISDECAPIDDGKAPTLNELWDPCFQKNITHVLLRSLLQPFCGLLRVRLWVFIGPRTQHPFECIRTITVADDAATLHKPEIDAYVGAKGNADDPYVKYTLARFATDPYARHQHKSMFGREDPNCKQLDKDPDGSWIVGPIVRQRRSTGVNILRGFVSADTHRPVRGSDGAMEIKEERVDTALQTFQKYAVDIVTDLLAYVMPLYPWADHN